VLIRQPELLYRVDRFLLEAGLNRLVAEDFQHADHQAIFQVLLDSVDQDVTEPLNFVMNTFSLPMMELADGMLERTQKVDPQKDRVLEDLVRGVLELRLRSVHQEIEYQRYLMEESQRQGDLKASQHLLTMMQYTQALKRIDKALARYTSRSSNS
jgi:DNA primase